MLPKSLKNMLLLAVALLVIATGVAVSQVVAHQYSTSLFEGAVARAENIAHKLSLEAVDKILINDLVSLQKMLDDQIYSDPSVAYLFVVRGGRLLTHTFMDGVPVNLVQANTIDRGENGNIEKIIAQDLADAKALNVRKTPGFFVNGKPLVSFGREQLYQLVQSEIKAQY